MSIDDVVYMVATPDEELFWHLMRGRETFYDENRVQRRWATWQEARQWSIDNLGVDPIPAGSTITLDGGLDDPGPTQKRLL